MAVVCGWTVPQTRADIFEWQWVNPTDLSQGKEFSFTVCPGGYGVNAIPGADLSGRDLTQLILSISTLPAKTFRTAP